VPDTGFEQHAAAPTLDAVPQPNICRGAMREVLADFPYADCIEPVPLLVSTTPSSGRGNDCTTTDDSCGTSLTTSGFSQRGQSHSQRKATHCRQRLMAKAVSPDFDSQSRQSVHRNVALRHLEELSIFRRQLQRVLTYVSHTFAGVDEDIANAVMSLCTQADELMDAAVTAHNILASVVAHIECHALPSLEAEIVYGRCHMVQSLLGFAQGWLPGGLRRDLCREYVGILSSLEYLLSCAELVVDYVEQPGWGQSDTTPTTVGRALEKLRDAYETLKCCSDSWCVLYSTRRQLMGVVEEAQELHCALLDARGMDALWMEKYVAYCSRLRAVCATYSGNRPNPEESSHLLPSDTYSTLSGLSFSTQEEL